MGKKIKIGLALGSGGARGMAHAGVLEVLEEAGIELAAITGTSMGAIIGGLYAEYPNAAVTWKRLLHYVTDEEFTSSWSAFVSRESASNEEADSLGRFHDLWDFMQRKLMAIKTVTRPSLQDQHRLRSPLTNLFKARTFADLKIPFATVAIDLISGRKVVFDTGSLIDGIYASSAIPAIFPPLDRNGMMISDGGAPYRVPVQVCRDLGADFVIAVDIPAFLETKFTSGLDLILRSNTIARQRLNNFVMATADLVIRPDVDDVHWADFRAGEVCRARGIEAGREALPKLEALVRRRRSWSYRLRRSLARRIDVPDGPPPLEVD
jgi:NTE family protein